MRNLIDALALKQFETHQHPMVVLNAGTGFGYVLGADREPERVGGPQVCVPLHDDALTESDVAKVLVQAAAANPLLLGNTKTLAENGGFWQKTPNPQALLVSPSLKGRFFQPGYPAFYMEEVPEGTLILVRPSPMAGFHVVRGRYQFGIIAHCKEGLTAVRFGSW